MEKDGEPSDRDPGGAGQNWVFPGRLPLQDDDKSDDSDSPWIVLGCLPTGEAESATARLESEGIEWKFGDAGEGTEQDRQPIHVREENLAAAREILTRPSEVHEAEIEADQRDEAQEREARAHEDWICPKCRQLTLVRLPHSPGWRAVRLGCLGVLLVPLTIALIAWAVPITPLEHALAEIPAGWKGLWILVVSAVAAAATVARRDKRCTDCGWKSGDGGQAKGSGRS